METRLTSDSPFPFGHPGQVAYFTVSTEGAVDFLRLRDELREAVRAALRGGPPIYAAWPGRHRTDVFRVDNVADLADRIGVQR